MTKNQSKARSDNGTSANPAVEPKPKRRAYSGAYKLRILQEADQSTEPGQIGALLRREGLYSSHLTEWRKQLLQLLLQALTPSKRGRKPDQAAAEMAALRRENERLRTQLSQAELIIAAQKKLSQALQNLMTDEPEN